MSKKFKEAAANIKPVYNTLISSKKDTQEVQEVQEVQHTQEVQDVQEVSPRYTQGRKGEKLPRVNMSFDTENLAYLRVMSALEGISMTRYVNRLIQADRTRRQDTYQAARSLTSDGRDGQ